MSDTGLAQRHAVEMQLLAIRCGAIYGALALAGLIAAHIALSDAFASLGVLLAVASATAAYVNFSIVAQAPESAWIGRTQALAITFGIASALLLVASPG